MKRYHKLLGPILLGLCAWGVVLGYCAKQGECGQPILDVIKVVSNLPITPLPIHAGRGSVGDIYSSRWSMLPKSGSVGQTVVDYYI